VSVHNCSLLLLWQQVQASSIHLLQELLQAAIDLKPRAIWLSFGDWDSLATPIKKAGIMIICQVQHLEQVEPALKAGADVIVGQVLPQASSSCSHSWFVFCKPNATAKCQLGLQAGHHHFFCFCDNRINANHFVPQSTTLATLPLAMICMNLSI